MKSILSCLIWYANKVKILWEGHKVWKKISHLFWRLLSKQMWSFQKTWTLKGMYWLEMIKCTYYYLCKWWLFVLIYNAKLENPTMVHHPRVFFSSPSNVLCLAWRQFVCGVSSLGLKNSTKKIRRHLWAFLNIKVYRDRYVIIHRPSGSWLFWLVL